MSEEEKSGWSLGMWILLIVVVLVFCLLSLPLMLRKKRDRGQTEAVSNARQIGLALFEFQNEYGKFPDESTAAKIREKTGMRDHLGSTSSNDYFQQLIAAGIVSDKFIFFAKTGFTKKQKQSDQAAGGPLAPGSVGFGYILNGKSSLESKGNPVRPVVCTPLGFDGTSVSRQTFDRSIDDGNAIVLRIDNSVASLPIQKETRLAILGGGKTLLQTGPDTIWPSTENPVIIPPLPKP